MGPNEVLDKGFVADTPVTKYHAVRQTDTENIAEADGVGQQALGIFQEEFDATDVDNGRVGRVRIMGISRAVAAGAIALGAKLRTAADGRLEAIPAAAGQVDQVGVALTAATQAGEWIDVMLTPGTQVTT